jgi:Peptidase A4 family
MQGQRSARPTPKHRLLRVSGALALATLVAGLAASGSIASTYHHSRVHATRTRGITSHGQIIRPLGINTNQSENWSGYNQGSLEQGGKLFHSVTGRWTVPTASAHVKGQAEYSSDWIGIGGGCVDAGCTVTDATLIQTGTEQDVSSSGAASYSAWYELIPAPSLTIAGMKIHPGNRMFASIATIASNVDVWKITIKDLTTGQSYTTTVPYTSTQDTAEWIEETPLIIGTNGGFAALPNLTRPAFDNVTVNGASARLKASEEMQLANANGRVIADPSGPDSDRNGFNVCAWAGTCSPPAS